jgi:predicted nucleotide-binding protein (sugar kinase/HSP70/actin superfamily)
MDNIQQVGIPRSIFHYEMGGIFQRFFENLGVKVILSPETNRSIFLQGKQKMIDEFCFPLKVYAGHVLALAQTGIYPIFIPVIVGSANNRSFLCHYQIRLSDMVRNLGLVDERHLLTGVFRFDSEGLLDGGFLQVGRALGFTGRIIAKALASARNSTIKDNDISLVNGRVTIGLLGRSYVVCDPWASMDLAGKLRALGCNVILEDDLPRDHFCPENLELHFALSARTLWAAREMNARPDINGVIFQIPFNCGPDGDITSQLIAEATKPFLTLVIDELTGQEGLLTRMEAFLDVLSSEPDLEKR